MTEADNEKPRAKNPNTLVSFSPETGQFLLQIPGQVQDLDQAWVSSPRPGV